jgi:hypothetical protein
MPLFGKAGERTDHVMASKDTNRAGMPLYLSKSGRSQPAETGPLKPEPLWHETLQLLTGFI